jgi:hypothetical protein
MRCPARVFRRASGEVAEAVKNVVYGIGIGLMAMVLTGPPAKAGITGVCPDGSMYIVPRAELIPCRNSKRVDPSDMPPIRPQNLPRPYGWEVFNRSKDPNNAYNVIDAGRAVRDVDRREQIREARVEPSATEARPTQRVASGAAPEPPPVSAPPPVRRSGPPDLALAPDEVRDLGLIVEYSQQRAPATLVRGRDGNESMVLQIAQSNSFEARLRDAAQRAGTPIAGPVVLFSARSQQPESFYANLTFVQGHVAFHPEMGAGTQLGVIDGRLGELGPGEGVLGFVVLPTHMDLSQPMDIYWDDRQVTATLRP